MKRVDPLSLIPRWLKRFPPSGILQHVLLLCVCVAVLLATGPSAMAASINHGQRIFAGYCAACHAGGTNLVQYERPLSPEAFSNFLSNYDRGHEAAIAAQVNHGKNAMPAFADKLSEQDIADVAAFVEQQANHGWS